MAITAAEATVRHTTLHCVLVCISCPHEVGAMSSQVELCEHHAKDYLQAAEKTEDPWRARCFSGMRWNGCGMGSQHPRDRSCVVFVDARQHQDQAWYIDAIYQVGLDWQLGGSAVDPSTNTKRPSDMLSPDRIERAE